MFDIGWPELFIIAAIALIVVGPKDLPRALRTITHVIRKARGMARDFQSGIDDVVREAELDDLRKQVESSSDFNIAKEIEDAVDPDGDWGDQFKDVERDLNDTAKALTDDSTAEAAQPAAEPLGPPPPPTEPVATPTPEPDVDKNQQTG